MRFARQVFPVPGVPAGGATQEWSAGHCGSPPQRQYPASQVPDGQWLPVEQRTPRWIGSIAGQVIVQLGFEPTKSSAPPPTEAIATPSDQVHDRRATEASTSPVNPSKTRTQHSSAKTASSLPSRSRSTAVVVDRPDAKS